MEGYHLQKREIENWIIDGPVPNWLLTALGRLYKAAGVAWVACHQVQLKGAVVISSHTATFAPGDLVPFAPGESLL